MHVPGARNDARTGVGAYRIRPPNGPTGPNDRNDARTAVAHSSLAGCLVGRMQYAPTRFPASAEAVRRRPRGLGKAQTSCFKVSEASERLKQVVSRFPTRRKGPNKLFQGFRRVGKAGKPAGYPSPARTRANFPASAEAVPDAPPEPFLYTESRTITLNPRFYGRLH